MKKYAGFLMIEVVLGCAILLVMLPLIIKLEISVKNIYVLIENKLVTVLMHLRHS